MTGDPKVLWPLQQAYLAADDVHTTRAIESAWQHATDGWRIAAPSVEHRIRAWTPPAEPSLEQRVAELERRYSELFIDITAGFIRVDRRIRAITHPDCICGTEDGASCPVHSHPEPTAPDDYTPGQYKRARGCAPPINPAPAAADLDPVRVEAAAKAGYASLYPDDEWSDLYPAVQQSRIEMARSIIRAYLNGGAS